VKGYRSRLRAIETDLSTERQASREAVAVVLMTLEIEPTPPADESAE